MRDQRKSGKEESSTIIKTDEETYILILREEKLNIGWKKCLVFNHINVKRCFKYWEYYHIAKNCVRNETCHKCAGNHKADYTETKKRYVNCMFKIRTCNLKINEHDSQSGMFI